MPDGFMSYQDALDELLLSEDELNDLVASGELRGFRDGDEVRFKREDVLTLKKSRETEPTIILSETQAEALGSYDDEAVLDLDSLSTDETVLNIEGLLEDEAEGTTPIPSSSLLEGEDELQIGAIGDETVLDTDDLNLDDEVELSDDDTLLGDEDDTLLAGGGSVRRVQMVRKESHAGMTVMLALTLLLTLAPAAILMSLMTGPNGIYPSWVEEGYLTALNGLIESIVGMF